MTRFYSVLQKWDFECFVFKGKNRTIKSHLPNAEILIAPSLLSLQPPAQKSTGLGWWAEKCYSHCLYCLRERRHKRAVGDLWRRGCGSPNERDQRRRQKGGSCLVVWRLLIQGCSPCRSWCALRCEGSQATYAILILITALHFYTAFHPRISKRFTNIN